MSLKSLFSIKLASVVLLMSFSYGLKAQPDSTSPKIDSAYVMEKLFAFSADSMMGRSTLQKALIEKSREFLIQELVDIGISAYVPGYEQKFDAVYQKDTIEVVNILGYVEGFSSDKLIVLSAHYDHMGMQDSLHIFNGADDNASGTIALMAMAKYFAANQPEHDMIFAFFDGEERGLLGAKHFVTSSVVDSSQLKLNVNMDMVSRGDKNELYAVGTYFYPKMKTYIAKAAEGKAIKMIYGADKPKEKPNWVMSSDHAAFHKQGVPFIYFGVDDHSDYHKMSDTAEKVNPDFYLTAIKVMLESVEIFDANLDYITVGKR